MASSRDDRKTAAAASDAAGGSLRSAKYWNSVVAVLPAGRRSWAVASIHGEAGRLAALHAELGRRIEPRDNIVYLGNFLGRGEDVGATIDELLSFRRRLMAAQIDVDENGAIAHLRGSQEEMWHKMLQLHLAPNPKDVLEWMLARGVGASLAAYGGGLTEARSAAAMGAHALSQWTNRLRAKIRDHDGHERLMSTLRRVGCTADGMMMFVNAGLNPALPLVEQRDAFWWGTRGFESIEQPYSGFQHIVRGTDPERRGIVVKAFTTSIDGGCGFGGPLLAACLDASGTLIDQIEA